MSKIKNLYYDRRTMLKVSFRLIVLFDRYILLGGQEIGYSYRIINISVIRYLNY